MKQREFVIGDIHGGLKALKQVLRLAEFDYENDKLICLGDVADGWPDVFECFEELLKIKNLVYVRGNHDSWLLDWLKNGRAPWQWTQQGGQATLDSYLKQDPREWKRHLRLLDESKFYYVDEKNRCFVHGGVSQRGIPIEQTDPEFLSWDRELWNDRHNLKDVPEFSEIFVGHTGIYHISHKPAHHANVWFMDTSGGWEGVLSMMDVNSKYFYQSDIVDQLYPGHRGRK